jgi:uncharacterized protein DUF6221
VTAVDDLATWLRGIWDARMRQLDADEQVAREASRDGDHTTPTGEHWHWVESEHDQPQELNPVTDEYINDGSEVALRSVEEYPTMSLPVSTLPHFIVSYAQEVPTVCGMHIARWDPARVLAEVEQERRDIEAKRRILDWLTRVDEYMDRDDMSWHRLGGAIDTDDAVRLLAQPYAGRPGFREEWRA